MRVITWRATMLAGDRSQGVVEAYTVKNIDKISIKIDQIFGLSPELLGNKSKRWENLTNLLICMRSSNVQGFGSIVPTLYEEEEE